ncbi:class I SAM-dependent methyltransferase [Polaribacter sp. L3A8]|uniref:class I SAM-dependent methyltransferase n=1 Tax=Polaribacter sp. L3A8 TaxID=2686361 RepID=UPI00131E94EB|nr:class I SAM-dependent methyltransferase [Polaribacter sp. L3A8]
MKVAFIKSNLQNPITKGSVNEINNNEIIFTCNTKFHIKNKIPIIINEGKSIFKISDVLEVKFTTQSSKYRNNSIKNYIRKKVLPSLSKDFTQEKRFKNLSEKFKGKNILIIGSGDKVGYYNNAFNQSLVINSDVHLQFSPDIVFDAHEIPFKDEAFDLVIASQVLEHTMKPWIVAKEMERVVKKNGEILVEVPFNFPYHSHPYDFFRFTYTGLRSLFTKSELILYEVPEGKAATIATMNSSFLVELSRNRLIRMVFLFLGRILFGWIKYIDLLYSSKSLNSTILPKGIVMIFRKDNIKRSNNTLLDDYFKLK